MNTQPEGRQADELLVLLEPFLNSEVRKSVQAITGLLALFPGQSLPEVTKAVRSLLATTGNSISAFVDRTRSLSSRTSSESIDAWAKDLGKLTAPDLKQIGKALGLELKGTKPQNVADLQRWVDSGGQTVPSDPVERSRQAASQYAGDLPDRIKTRGIDGQLAQEIRRQAEAAAKALNKLEFVEFGKLVGIPVNGTKPAMLKQIVDFADRAAVSRTQTNF